MNTAATESERGRPFTFSGDYSTQNELQSFAQIHPITHPGLSTTETGVLGSSLDFDGDARMQSAQVGAYPVTMSGGSIMSSGEQESLRGRLLTFSGDSIMESGPPMSLAGHPITHSGFSFVSSALPDSHQRQPIGSSGRYSAAVRSERDSLEAYPVTLSGASFMNTGDQASVQARPITFSGEGSIADSDMQTSARGHPITYSGSSMVSAGDLVSSQAQPGHSPYHSIATIEVPAHTSAGSSGAQTSTDAYGGRGNAYGGEGSAQAEGHPITLSDDSILSSGAEFSQSTTRPADGDLQPLPIHASVVAQGRPAGANRTSGHSGPANAMVICPLVSDVSQQGICCDLCMVWYSLCPAY